MDGARFFGGSWTVVAILLKLSSAETALSIRLGSHDYFSSGAFLSCSGEVCIT